MKLLKFTALLLLLSAAALAAPSSLRADCIDYGDYIRWLGGSTTGVGKPSAAYGNVVYASPSPAVIRAYEVSDPLHPVPGAQLNCGGTWIASMERSGATLFVGTLTAGVRVVSLATPMAPVIVATIPGSSYATGLCAVGNTLYIVWDGVSLDIYDITNPSSPAFASSVPLPEIPMASVTVAQGYAYVGTDNGVRILDVEPAGSAHQAGTFGAGSGWSLIADGGRLYAGGEAVSLRIYSLAFPTAPSLLGSIGAVSSKVRTVGGNQVYLSTAQGMMIVDALAPGSPSIRALAAGKATASTADAVLVYPDHLFYQGLQVFDTSVSSESPPILRTDPTFPAAMASERYGDQLFVAAGSAGLYVYDLIPGGAPVLSASLPSINAQDVSVSWPLVCVGTPTGLSIVDAGTPGELDILATALAGTSVLSVATTPGRAYAGTNDVVYGFDLSNPAAPVQIGVAWGGARFYREVHASGNVLYAIGIAISTSQEDVLFAFDVSNPGTWYPTDGVNFIQSFVPAGAFGYASVRLVSDGQTTGRELGTLDLSDPLHPEIVAQLLCRGSGPLAVDGVVLYQTQVDLGVELFDLAVPLQPVSIGQSPTIAGAKDAVVYGDEVYVTSSAGGLTVLPLQCSSSAGAPEALLPHHAIHAMPNPTAGECRVIFQLPGASTVRMTVQDVAGRIVVQLAEQTLAAGVHELYWDGRGAGGEALPSGVYFARVRGAGIDAATRVVLRR